MRLVLKYFFLLLGIGMNLSKVCAQQIDYARFQEDNVSAGTQYKIIGKIDKKYYIYIQNERGARIDVYDEQMKLMNSLPFEQDSKIGKITFLPNAASLVSIYTTSERNHIYIWKSFIDLLGNSIITPVLLDSVSIANPEAGRLMQFIEDEGRQCVSLFGYSLRGKDSLLMLNYLYEKNTDQWNRRLVYIGTALAPNQVFDNYSIAPSGDISFLSRWRKNSSIEFVQFVHLAKNANNIEVRELEEAMVPNQTHIQYNRTSSSWSVYGFYFNVDNRDRGLMYQEWSNQELQLIFNKSISFDSVALHKQPKLKKDEEPEQEDDLDEDELKRRQEIRNLFQVSNFQIRQFIKLSDSSLILIAEETGSINFNTLNNNNNVRSGMPNWMPSFSVGMGTGFRTGGSGGMGFGTSMSTPLFPNQASINRSLQDNYKGNIVAICFDKNGVWKWGNIVYKGQSDKMNLGSAYTLVSSPRYLRFLYLSNYSYTPLLSVNLSPEGIIGPDKPLLNVDVAYNYLLNEAQQISSNQIIIPTLYKKYITFVKLKFYER